MSPDRKPEVKVVASTVATFAAGMIITWLSAQLDTSLSPEAQNGILTLCTTAATFIVGYFAKHTSRE